MPGFSCCMWHLVPWPGIEPRPPALGAQNLRHWTTREVLITVFKRLSKAQNVAQPTKFLCVTTVKTVGFSLMHGLEFWMNALPRCISWHSERGAKLEGQYLQGAEAGKQENHPLVLWSIDVPRDAAKLLTLFGEGFLRTVKPGKDLEDHVTMSLEKGN